MIPATHGAGAPMFTMLLTAAAPSFAATPTDDQIHTMVEQALNRRLPREGTCFARPEVPEVFRDVVAVGIRKKGVGCSLLVVHSGDKLRKVDIAATTAIKASVWKAQSPTQRAESLAGWTDAVLLAFGNPEGEASTSVRGDKATVKRTFLARGEGDGISVRKSGTFTYDVTNGKLLDQAETESAYYRTALTVRPQRVTGNLTPESVSEALSSKGRIIKRCFVDAWESDLTLDGRVQLQWTVAEGKTDDLTVLGGDDSPEQLAKCYAFAAVNTIEWPAEAQGSVHWVFAAQRGKISKPQN